MCEDCQDVQSMLPSIESFQARLKLPKVNYVFYEYFFRAVMGEARWKQRLQEDKRLGTTNAEAFTHATIQNNYFSWLFQYKCSREGVGLKTEYEYKPPAQEHADENEENHEDKIKIFCGVLGDGGVEILVPEKKGDDYRYLLEDSATREEYQAAMERTRIAQLKVLEDLSDGAHKQTFDDAVGKHSEYSERGAEEDHQTSENAREERKKKKRKCLMDLKPYTGKGVEKSAGSKKRRCKGWSDEGKKFFMDMIGEIKADIESGSHDKWEKVYRQIIETIETCKNVGDDNVSETPGFVVNYDHLYGNVKKHGV